MKTLKINPLAVLVCIVLLHVLGFLWYGPIFGETWMGMVGIDMATVQQSDPGIGIWVMNFIACAASVIMLAWLFTKLDIRSGVRGAGIAFLIVLCFHHFWMMSGNMFAQEPYGLAWITGGFTLTGLTICGFILGAWTKTDA